MSYTSQIIQMHKAEKNKGIPFPFLETTLEEGVPELINDICVAVLKRALCHSITLASKRGAIIISHSTMYRTTKDLEYDLHFFDELMKMIEESARHASTEPEIDYLNQSVSAELIKPLLAQNEIEITSYALALLHRIPEALAFSILFFTPNYDKNIITLDSISKYMKSHNEHLFNNLPVFIDNYDMEVDHDSYPSSSSDE